MSNAILDRPSRPVRNWLLVGVVMVIMQVFIGGVTRLTGSGLSITKWEIVTGTLPPLSTAAWQETFELYKATPQYQKINQGMSLSAFKFIFFWEYFHRLWARTLGFVFLIPFLWFLYKKMLPTWLLRRLGITVLLGALVATFGWIMVASGLINRPWVNAYKLTLHLSLALIVLSYLWWTYLLTWQQEVNPVPQRSRWSNWSIVLFSVTFFQIMLGGVMSGAKAGLFFPTWPLIDGGIIPSVILQSANWNIQNIIEYDRHPFMSGLIQTLHRNVAYILAVLIALYVWRARLLHTRLLTVRIHAALLFTLALQIILGITTLISCRGTIPVALGVLHQLVAVILLMVVLANVFQHVRWSKD
jgi:cytochrome c oxidase assembly protein subunit 15